MAKKTAKTPAAKSRSARGTTSTRGQARGTATPRAGRAPSTTAGRTAGKAGKRPSGKPAGRAAATVADHEESGLTPEECQSLKDHVEAEVDRFLREVGYDDLTGRIDEDGGRQFEMGAAEGTAFAMIEDGDVVFHVFAPVLDLPADTRRAAPLMRKILGINAVLSGAVRLGLLGDTVYAMATKSAQLMDDEDFGEYIHDVAVIGDVAIKELRKK